MKTKVTFLAFILFTVFAAPRDSSSQDNFFNLPNSKIPGPTVTLPGEHYPASVVAVNHVTSDYPTDNINLVQISSLNGIRALATATQQTGIAGSSGVLWTVAAVSNTSANDTIY